MSTGAYLILLSWPFAAMILVLAGHLSLGFYFKTRVWRLLLALGLTCFLGVFYLSFVWSRDKGVGYLDSLAFTLINGVIYMGLFYGYFTLMNLNLTALRIRLLKLLLQAEGQQLSADTLLHLYDPKTVLDWRLCRLLKMRQIREIAPDTYALDRKWAFYLSCMVVLLRRLFNIKPMV